MVTRADVEDSIDLGADADGYGATVPYSIVLYDSALIYTTVYEYTCRNYTSIYSNHPSLRKQAKSRGSGFLARQQHPTSFLS